ncbi:sodium-dependent transporter [Floccifex sp.]|uniref:sodium-dependent transporter n=1 Tax=Floccifex sp. TaxID=2815810 RepID=UPI002A748279|nr:sodium-dependent transporter [Floccifex sp.]MDY2957419.1 sodium-dependent transporter [Floccifex sp.]
MRERFSSRLGFILLSAGCAIGLGNVWRFPYIVGQYGGAAFVLIYLFFLIILGLPIMVMEYSVGRASQKSAALSFDVLEPKGTKWHWLKYVSLCGNYLLMMFYTTVCGWMFYYFYKMLTNGFVGMSTEQINNGFYEMLSVPQIQVGMMILVVCIGFLICSKGLQNGVEKISKYMMICLLGIMGILVIRTLSLPGAMEGVKFYLLPDFSKMTNLSEVIFAAMGQAFFTLSLGIGAIAIFGSYIDKEKKLTQEAISVVCLDTFVAIVSGLIVIPACFAYGVSPGQGPGLIFQTIPNIFVNMNYGNIWGALFFLFLSFAALTTIIAVFQNIITMTKELFNWSHKKAIIINFVLIILLSLPCALGFNVLSFIQPMGAGSTIQDLEDFIVSNNLLPLGSLGYVLFCCSKKGWGFDNFIKEANTGKGISFPRKLRFYLTYIIPIIVIIIFIQGYISLF